MDIRFTRRPRIRTIKESGRSNLYYLGRKGFTRTISLEKLVTSVEKGAPVVPRLPSSRRILVFRKALLDEIHTLSLCTHPNIIHLVGIDEQYGMVLEYLPGGNVRNFLKKVKDVS